MKANSINLSVWMFGKAAPAALFLFYYWACTVAGWTPAFRYVQAVSLVLAAVLVWAQVSYARKQKLFDEFARENLKTTDSICLRVAYVLMTAAALACVLVLSLFTGAAAAGSGDVLADAGTEDPSAAPAEPWAA